MPYGDVCRTANCEAEREAIHMWTWTNKQVFKSFTCEQRGGEGWGQGQKGREWERGGKSES